MELLQVITMEVLKHCKFPGKSFVTISNTPLLRLIPIVCARWYRPVVAGRRIFSLRPDWTKEQDSISKSKQVTNQADSSNEICIYC